MNKRIKIQRTFLSLIILSFSLILVGQEDASTTTEPSKREIRQNLVLKVYKTDAKGKNQRLDEEIIYNEDGYKVEEINHAANGIKSRTLYEYDENNRCVKEILYDERKKIKRIRRIEYNPDGTKKAHYNYLPTGRLYSTKQYKYTY